jgi:hypothetical protein
VELGFGPVTYSTFIEVKEKGRDVSKPVRRMRVVNSMLTLPPEGTNRYVSGEPRRRG